ncbi:MAG: prepilin peptidase [Gemmatimonadetes bacterium]|nr:prepilin peptidase [Gemmatimonadota bacterium]
MGSLFTTLLLAIALTDLRTYLIPDELSIGGALLGLLVSLLPGGLTPLHSLVGAVVGGGLLYAVAWLGALVFRKEAMGGGDIKMMAMVGAFVGWQGVFLTLFIGSLLGSLIFGPISLVRRLRSSVPAEPPLEPVTIPAAAVSPHQTGNPPPGNAATSAAPDLAEEASGAGEEVDRALVPFGLFLAPAAALTYYLADELIRGYLRLVGLEG